MIRTLNPDGTVTVVSALCVEVHDRNGNILSSREPTAEEVAQAEAAEGLPPLTTTPRHAVEPGTYRDASTGEFVAPEYAAAHPATTVSVDTETVPGLRAQVEALTAENAQLRAELDARGDA